MRPVQDVDVLIDSSPGSRKRSLLASLVPAIIVVILDQATKIWAVDRLVAGPCTEEGDGCIDLLLSLRLHLVYNRGAAFSTGTDLGPLFGLIALVMSAGLLVVASRRRDRWTPVLLGLIAGGAIGNLIDRIARADDGILSGPVVDFIDLQWWPVFNIADSAVVVGVLAYIVYSLFEPERSEPDPSDAGPELEPEPETSEVGRSESSD